MSRKQVDLHGYTRAEAERLVARIIDAARLANKQDEILFITGHGTIQRFLLDYLGEQGVERHIQLGNDGCIIANVE